MLMVNPLVRWVIWPDVLPAVNIKYSVLVIRFFKKGKILRWEKHTLIIGEFGQEWILWDFFRLENQGRGRNDISVRRVSNLMANRKIKSCFCHFKWAWKRPLWLFYPTLTLRASVARALLEVLVSILEPDSPVEPNVLSTVLQTFLDFLILCFWEIPFSNNKHTVTAYRKLRAFQALKVWSAFFCLLCWPDSWAMRCSLTCPRSHRWEVVHSGGFRALVSPWL